MPVSLTLDPLQIDSDGDIIEPGFEYRAAVLTVNNGLADQHRINFSDNIILNGLTDVSSEIILTDTDNNHNASDIRVNLIKGDHPLTVLEYRILLVPSSDVPDFNITQALNAIPPEYYSFSPEPGGSYEIVLPYFTLDINGNSIVEGIGYNAYILSIATEYGTSNILSLSSNELILQDQPLSVETENNLYVNVVYLNGSLITDIGSYLNNFGDIEIINSIGQKLLSRKITEKTSAIKIELTDSIYFISVMVDGKRSVKK